MEDSLNQSSESKPSFTNFLDQLSEIRNQLEQLRLKIEDPRAQGFLFTAQGQISSYLDSAARYKIS